MLRILITRDIQIKIIERQHLTARGMAATKKTKKKQMVVRMWIKGNIDTLLAGM